MVANINIEILLLPSFAYCKLGNTQQIDGIILKITPHTALSIHTLLEYACIKNIDRIVTNKDKTIDTINNNVFPIFSM